MQAGIYQKYRDFAKILDDKTEQDGDCIIWKAGCHKQGYPMTRWEGKMVQVARHLISEKIGRPILRSERVRNTACGNVKCVNPDHYEVHQRGTMEWGMTKRWTTLEEKQRLRDLWFAQSLEERESWGRKMRFAQEHNLNPATLNLLINNAFVLFDLD